MYQTFSSKTMGTNSPYICNMYLKTFSICTFTQHVKQMVNKVMIHRENAH